MDEMLTGWMAEGNCRNHPPATFFPSDGVGVDRARKICATCPVIESCLEYALAPPHRARRLGRLLRAGAPPDPEAPPPAPSPSEPTGDEPSRDHAAWSRGPRGLQADQPRPKASSRPSPAPCDPVHERRVGAARLDVRRPSSGAGLGPDQHHDVGADLGQHRPGAAPRRTIHARPLAEQPALLAAGGEPRLRDVVAEQHEDRQRSRAVACRSPAAAIRGRSGAVQVGRSRSRRAGRARPSARSGAAASSADGALRRAVTPRGG